MLLVQQLLLTLLPEDIIRDKEENMVEKFLLVGPLYFSAVNYEQHARTIAMLFNEEKQNKNSVYARKEGQTTLQRLEPISIMRYASGVDQLAFGFWLAMVELAAISIDINGGDPAEEVRYNELIEWLKPQENSYPRLTEIMTIKQATEMAYWL